MNDEPKRLLDEDPEGAASALIRAALEDGPPPPLEAKEQVAEELGIDRATITSIKQRRAIAWALSSGIAAAAAFAIWMVLPEPSSPEPASEQASPAYAPPALPTAPTADPAKPPLWHPASPITPEPTTPLPTYTGPLPSSSASARPGTSVKIIPLPSAKVIKAFPKDPKF